jgi:hypothetical protein
MNSHNTYVAFDARGVIDPVYSNLYTFHIMQEWERALPQRYHFLNMSEIDFSALHEDLLDTTVKHKLISIMQRADNLLVMASPVMDVESPILNWQISRAVNRFRLPVIVAYVGLDRVDDSTLVRFRAWQPNKIRKYISRDSARMCHIPLTKDKLERALGAFSVHDGTYPWNSTTIF